MYRLLILTSAFLFALSGAAFAQGNKIVVIGEDGSVSELDLGPSPSAPPEAQAKPPKEKRAAPPPPVQLRKNPAPVPAPVMADPAPAPKAAPKTAVKETTAKPVKPAKKPAVPAQKKVEKKTGKKSKKKKGEAKAAPAQAAPHPAVTAAPARAQRLGPNMTPDDAIRIAIDAGPPARSVNAYPVNYNGIHAYQVVFRTEDGDISVFVDRETAQIVR